MGNRFEGKVALVTGSTQGIGAAANDLFVAEGASGVVVTGRNVVRGESVRDRYLQVGCDAIFIQADLGDAVACQTQVGVGTVLAVAARRGGWARAPRRRHAFIVRVPRNA